MMYSCLAGWNGSFRKIPPSVWLGGDGYLVVENLLLTKRVVV